MKCPVCSKEMEVPGSDSSASLYYDCEHCYSNLLIKNGKCEVLSESLEVSSPEDQSVEQESVQEESAGKEVTQEESTEQDIAQQEVVEETIEQSLEKTSLSTVPSLGEEESEEQDFETEQQSSEDTSLEDFSDVSEYGNNQGVAQDGLFYYDLTLSEINSKELAEEIQNILQDSRFQFGPESHNLSIEDGTLNLIKISPVKAHIIVQSLMGLPLKMSWKQHLIIDQE